MVRSKCLKGYKKFYQELENNAQAHIMGYGSSDRDVSVAIGSFHTEGPMLGIGVVPLIYYYIEIPYAGTRGYLVLL